MYWTTPTTTHPKSRRPHPLNTTLPTSPSSYIHALSHLLLLLINPLSTALLPLFRTYTTLHATSSPPSSLMSVYPPPYDDTASVLQTLHAYICLLVQEIQDHYEEFCELYGWVGVGDLVGMVEREGTDGKGEERMREVVRAWDALLFLVEGEEVRRFCGEGVRLGDSVERLAWGEGGEGRGERVE